MHELNWHQFICKYDDHSVVEYVMIYDTNTAKNNCNLTQGKPYVFKKKKKCLRGPMPHIVNDE